MTGFMGEGVGKVGEVDKWMDGWVMDRWVGEQIDEWLNT